MRKKIVLLLLLCLIHASQLLQAQLVQVAETELFDEPKDGEAKIIQLTNGHTMFYLQENKTISLQLFNESHKKLSEKNIEPGFGLKDAHLNNLFEIKGDLVMFFVKVEDRIVKLYRLTIDGNTGDVKEEKLVEEQPKMSKYAGVAYDFGYVDAHAFYVAKDIYNDHYAIAKINPREADRSKRIEIILFGPDHKEAGRSYYASPIEYKFTCCIDMVVYQQDKVALLMSGYNTKRTGGPETASYVAVLSRENKTTRVIDLEFEKDRYMAKGSIQYNAITKELVALALGQNVEGSATYGFSSINFTPEIIVCDPVAGKVIREKPITVTDEVDGTTKSLFGTNPPYRLVPQNLLINDDGGYSVLSEDFGYFIPDKGGFISSFTGSVLMSRYTADLTLKQSYLVPKSHWLERQVLQPFYVRDWARLTTSLGHSNPFKSFSYLNTTASHYIVFNDVEENAKTVLKGGKLTNIKGVSESDAFVYKLTGSAAIPERDFVFKNTGDPQMHQLLFSPIYVYDKKRNLYITLKMVKGKKEGASIIWLSPE